MSLHVGLNLVDPTHYAGWDGPLSACEFDAQDMTRIARAAGMTPKVLLTRQATRSAVLSGIRAAAKKLVSGDLFFLSYSGHGGQVPDVTAEEDDRQDETWCLYDGQLIDDELYFELSRFAAGVRILVLSDSCHSGTVTRAAATEKTAAAGRSGRPKWMPRTIATKTYEANRSFYDKLQRAVAKAATPNGGRSVPRDDPDAALAAVGVVGQRPERIAGRMSAAVILISGCQDNQTSMDGDRNGAFTERLLAVWNSGQFVGNYAQFHAAIKSGMPPSQTPNLYTLGRVKSFLAQRPFHTSGSAGVRSVRTALAFVDGLAIAKTPKSRAAKTPPAIQTALDAAKDQAAIVGSQIVSFVKGVTAERRQQIIDSSLLAQLAAKKKVPDSTRLYDWYDTYFDVLHNIGWVIQDQGFAEYKESSTNFESHKAILAVAATVLGPAPGALAIVKTTLESLQSMDEDSPWITLFNRESQSAKAARFQISLAAEDEDGGFFVNLMAFGLEAKAKVTQVLFFKAKRQDVKFQHFGGKVTVNGTVLDAIHGKIKEKLAGEASQYIAQLPDL